MTIQFNNVPSNIRVPLFWAEINPAQSPYQSNARCLLIGQMDTTSAFAGSAIPGQPIQIIDNAAGMFGPKSMLADMYSVARANGPFQEFWALPLADNAAGVAAVGAIDIVNMPVNSAQTIAVWIGEVRVQTVAYTTDTAATLAARLFAAIQASAAPLPVVATYVAASSTITLTAFHKGVQGDSIRLDTNFYGGEGPTSTKVLQLTQLTGGTGDPLLSTAISNLGDDEFDWIGCPYSDATNMVTMANFLNGVSGRWSPYQQLYGHYLTTMADTAANLATFGLTQNDPHLTVLGTYKWQSPTWRVAAAQAAIVAVHLQDAPELSRPLQTLQMIGILGPKSPADYFTITTRQSLYYDGISACHISKDRTVHLDRIITTYRLNAWGSPDPSWLDLNTLAQSMFAIRYLKAKVTGQWGRAALADDNPSNIQGLATPKAIKQTIMHGYADLLSLGVVENQSVFEQSLIVERNQSDANRVDVYLPVDVTNQLRIIAVNMTTYLQYGTF